MTSPLYERGGLDFRPQDGKTSERQFAIIAFVIGRAAPDHKQPPGLENPINDAIISLPDLIMLRAGKLFTTRWSRIFFNQIDAIDDAPEVLFGNRVRVLANSSAVFL
jgi:hypothetical protein